jgi:hypothetical protein
LSPVPILILGTKADLLKDVEPEQKKVMSRFLRFVAHSRGASLLFVSQKDEGSIARVSKENKLNENSSINCKVIAETIFVASGI